VNQHHRAFLAAAVLAALAGCATRDEKADQAMIRARRDPGAEAALGRVAGPGAPAAQAPATGRTVAGKGPGLRGEPAAEPSPAPVRVAQAASPPAQPVGPPAPAPETPAAPGSPAPAMRDGIVVAVRGDIVYVDLGKGDGLAPGQGLRVVRSGTPLVHPITGEALGPVDDEVAVLQVLSVADKYATTRAVRVAAGMTIEAKDRVIAGAGATAVAAAPAPAPPAPAQAQPAASPAQPPAVAAPSTPQTAAEGTGFALDRSRIATSQQVPYEIRDLAVADLDGDGRVEIVALNEFQLVIYRWTGRNLEMRFEEEETPRRYYITVDAADLDGDGKAEIVVNDAFGDGVRAFVMQQQGKSFRRTDLPRNHYFRVLGTEIGQPTLVGQRRGTAAERFVGDVHKYAWQRGRARRGDVLWVPARASVFDIQLYRTEDGKADLAVLTPGNNLALYRGKDEVWVSQQSYDGTKNRVIEKNPAPPSSTEAGIPVETAIAGRIVPVTGVLGGEGRPVPAFVLRRNERGSFIARQWSFARGRVIGLAVDGQLNRELWETDAFDGYVAGAHLADLGPVRNGVGGRALVIAVDQQRGLFKAARSVIVVQGLK
jgi:hypothetical protein